MDNADQSSRVPNRGSFDAASLLAPSSTIFNAHSPSSVPSPLPHLTHSPSAFSMLGRNAVLVPPPPLPLSSSSSSPSSSKSDSPSTKSGGKLCSPIIHQSASDALSSLASSSAGSCGWWSASSPLVSTADFPGCGVTSISDPFSRTAICGRSLAASHLPLPPPHRIVEEVLGHLYAKPASAEFKAESQISGIRDAKQLVSKVTAALSNSDIQTSGQLSTIGVVPHEKDFISSKSEQHASSNIPTSLSTVLPISSKKSEEGKSTLVVPAPPKPSRKRTPKANLAALGDTIKNGKRTKANSDRSKSRSNRKPKENKKSLSPSKTMTPPKIINHSKKPMPSPAHSSSIFAVSPKTTPLKPKINACIDDDVNMSVPLDLCVKKQEPTTFEVTSSTFQSSFAPSFISNTKKQLHIPMFNPLTGQKLPATTPRRRGRKPKFSVPGNMIPEVAHQFKQNNVHDLSSLLLPQKPMSLPPHPCSSSQNSDLMSMKKNANSPAAIKSHLYPCDIANPLTIPRKNFTLDSLLGESNGNMLLDHHFDGFPSSSMDSKMRNKERSRYSNRIKQIEDNAREFTTYAKVDSSSGTDDIDLFSYIDSDDSDSEESISGNASTSTGHKRSCDEDGEDYGGKRRRVVPDEREIQIPLEHGWRRETKIRCFSRAGVRGEVIYYTPCGKKLRSYPEVVRYLVKNNITDISRDNFTFSTKVNVGDFLEATASSTGEEYTLLSEQEVLARISEIRSRKGRIGVQNRKSLQRSVEREDQQRQWEQKQLQHQLEQQVEESRRQKEQQRLLKQQERFERLEQLRIEREIRAQQALEEQELKRQQAAFLREQEMEKRREMLLMVDLERERRRQHMMLVRALETRKKQEERERKREEIMYEKRISREKKIEQRRIEMDYLRELKKPVEDMVLKDSATFPEFKRISGVKLAGKTFADMLMIFEFLHNFGETLGFDSDSLPSLNTLQMAFLNLDEKHEEELLSITHHLLVCAIEDPGVPHCSEASTVLGQNLKDADVTNNNVSEVLRLYFTAQDKRSELCFWMQAKPFLSLTSAQKVEILAYICDDLLGSRVLMKKIDSNIESVNVLRKDKWLVEGDLRRLKTVQQRRLLRAKQQTYEENKLNVSQNNSTADTSSNNVSKDGNASNLEVKDNSECDKEKIDDLDNDNESANESDDEHNEPQVHIIPADIEFFHDEDLQLSNEELTKKVEKLTKQLSSFSNKLTKALHTIRAVTFGQDKYHRRYWVLPKAGGIFVESMESSELPSNVEVILEASKPDPDAPGEKEGCEAGEKESEVKKEDNEETDENKEQEEVETEIKKDEQEEDSEEKEKPLVKEEEEQTAEPCKEEKEEETAEKEAIPGEVKEENEEADEEKLEAVKSAENDKEEVADEDLEGVNEKMDVDLAETSKEKEEEEMESKDEDEDKSIKQEEENLDHKESVSPEKDCVQLDLSLPKEQSEKIEKKSSPSKDSAIIRDKTFPCQFTDKKPEKKTDVNIFMPKFCDTMGLDNCSTLNHGIPNSADHKGMNPALSANQNWLLHSPFFASLLAGNLMFNGPMMSQREGNGTYFNLPKNDFNNPFGPFLGTPNLFSPEQLYKSLTDKQSNQKPWFSILPRMPCDEDSLPKSQAKNLFNAAACSSAQMFLQNSPCLQGMKGSAHQGSSHSMSSGNIQPTAGQLSNLQLEILNGMPPGFFMHPFMSHQFGPAFNNMPTSCTAASSFTPTLTHSSPLGDFNLNLGHPPASSTPSSIPTPSATPGPSQGCSTPTFRDSPTPSIKKLMMEKMTQEYKKPKPIPIELQRGWWRITDSSQLKDLINSLHHRGIREKMLQKSLQKHYNYACNSCSQGSVEDVKLEITELDESIADLPQGVPAIDNLEDWSREVALRVDMAILEQIENLEEKIDGASMQVKGWKPPSKLSNDPSMKFIPACELYLQMKCDIPDSPREKTPKKSGKKSARKRRAEAKKRAAEAQELLLAEAEAKAEEAEGEEKDDSTAKEPAAEEKEKANEEEEQEKPSDEIVLPPGTVNPVEEGKTRLLMVEAAIERRYLKPPLGYNANDLSRSALTSSHQSSDNGDDDIIPTGLQKWRNAVQACRSSSQLAMCINFLENHTAWDKSIMRASCQFCHSGENEEMLLLCDGCDKGYHTYCFKPKMDKIPEGDWYCYECLNKATGDNVCVICGKKGKLIDCVACPKCFHLSCLEPPLSKMPKGKWYCSGCSQSRPVKKSSKKNSSTKNEKEPKEPSTSKKAEPEPKPAKPKASEKKERKEKNRNQVIEDLASIISVIEEMEKHDDSWPFLTPVNTKQFPTYRKVIKKPMDLLTIRNKLDTNQYKSKEDFANDVRLIFDNCETFNEDDSPVGQAGHTMRAFFDTRWTELCST